jgi:dienelactone hydrolase
MMTPALIKKGYAVVLLDSFSPRGFSTVCANKFQMWQEARVTDVIAVLKKLQIDARQS